MERGLAAIIPLIVRGPHGNPVPLEGLVDTGFDGFLTLPPDTISGLNLLPWLRLETVILGDGPDMTGDGYVVAVDWDGQELIVEAGESDTEPLVGLSRMAGYSIHIENVDGGMVELKPL